MGRLLLALGFSWIVSGAALAVAQSAPVAPQAGTAQSWFELGMARSQAGDWPAAFDAFQESLARERRASTLYNLAVAALELGRPLDALDALDAFDGVVDPVSHAAYISEAAQLRERASSRVGTLRLRTDPATLALRLDGVAISPGPRAERTLHLLPGHHTLRGEAAGYVPQGLGVSVDAGDVVSVELALVALAPPARAPVPEQPIPAAADQRRRRWIIAASVGAVAVAALITGVAIAARNRADRDDYSGSSGLTF